VLPFSAIRTRLQSPVFGCCTTSLYLPVPDHKTSARIAVTVTICAGRTPAARRPAAGPPADGRRAP
jgi:hypothetical protein